MAGEMFYTLWNYIQAGQYGHVLIYTFNNYFPYGFIFWMIGFAIYIILWKTRNIVIAGAVTALYFLVLSASPFITSIYVRQVMKWVGIIVGVSVGYYIYRLIKGGE